MDLLSGSRRGPVSPVIPAVSVVRIIPDALTILGPTVSFLQRVTVIRRRSHATGKGQSDCKAAYEQTANRSCDCQADCCGEWPNDEYRGFQNEVYKSASVSCRHHRRNAIRLLERTHVLPTRTELLPALSEPFMLRVPTQLLPNNGSIAMYGAEPAGDLLRQNDRRI